MSIRNILLLFFFIVLVAPLAFGVDITPGGNLNGRNFYYMYDFVNISATHFYGNGSGLTNTGATYTEDSPYLTLAGTVFGFSEPTLNTTIDARRINNCSIDGSCPLITYNSGLNTTIDARRINNCSVDESCPLITYNSKLSYTNGNNVTGWVGNWSNDQSSYWNTSSDIDTVLSANEVSESKISFDTTCASGNHLYVSSNDLACEADTVDTNESYHVNNMIGTTTCPATSFYTDFNSFGVPSCTSLTAGSNIDVASFKVSLENDINITDLVVYNSPVECPAGTYMTYTNMSESVCESVADTNLTDIDILYYANGGCIWHNGTSLRIENVCTV